MDRTRMMSCEILLEANGFIYPVSKTIPASGDVGFVWRENFLLGVDVDQISSTRLFFVVKEHLTDEQLKIFGKTKSIPLTDIVALGRTDTWLQLIDDSSLSNQNVTAAALHVVFDYQQPTVEALVGSVVSPKSARDEARSSPKSAASPKLQTTADSSKRDAGVGVVLASAGGGEYQVEYLAEVIVSWTSALWPDSMAGRPSAGEREDSSWGLSLRCGRAGGAGKNLDRDSAHAARAAELSGDHDV
eukprot:758883-Hanusia_phi.AAC.5